MPSHLRNMVHLKRRLTLNVKVPTVFQPVEFAHNDLPLVSICPCFPEVCDCVGTS